MTEFEEDNDEEEPERHDDNFSAGCGCFPILVVLFIAGPLVIAVLGDAVQAWSHLFYGLGRSLRFTNL